MKIYFEDGYLVLGHNAPDFNFVVDAQNGYSNNESYLNFLHKHVPDCSVYTNSLVAISNSYCWNDELKVPELYLRAGESNEFKRVDELTDRQLRCGHNLLALFRNNGFFKANYPKIICDFGGNYPKEKN